LLKLFEGARLDLAYTLPSHAELGGEIFERHGIVGEATRLDNAALTRIEYTERADQRVVADREFLRLGKRVFRIVLVVDRPILPLAIAVVSQGSKIRVLKTSPSRLHAFDHLAAPVEVAAIFPLVAWIERQGSRQRFLGTRYDARLPLLLGKAIVVLVEEIIPHAGCMRQQHPGRYVALGHAETRFAVRSRRPRRR
jgi:hypothetical protein